MLRRVLSTGKKALLVLPYVSLCCEKVARFARVIIQLLYLYCYAWLDLGTYSD